ncbi:MAG: hypothetical protein HY327_10225 [Chloroflexi bacterium]|nr:hypothetical protein [Chloroflexota bacterium]
MDADDAILVVLMNNPRDLEIARREHWYRIPVKHAPEQISRARYVAFFLTSAFRADKWTIREYAPVQGNELARRSDLLPEEAEHPRAGNAYYKLQLGQVIALPRPIASRIKRRFVWFWTTGEKFSRAVEFNDLLGASGADDALWNALKAQGIAAERQVTVQEGRARYRVDFWIACARGDIALMLGKDALPKNKKWRGVRAGVRDAQTVAQVRGMIDELGGLKFFSTGQRREHSG